MTLLRDRQVTLSSVAVCMVCMFTHRLLLKGNRTMTVRYIEETLKRLAIHKVFCKVQDTLDNYAYITVRDMETIGIATYHHTQELYKDDLFGEELELKINQFISTELTRVHSNKH